MWKFWLFFTIVLITLFFLPVGAQPLTDKSSTWSIDDIILSEGAANFQLSPDNKWAVWVKSTPDVEKGEAVSNLILTSLTEKREITLTHGSDICSKPQWSPNGQLIAFLSTRPRPKNKADKTEEESKTQIWLINPFGGESWPLTELDRGVTSFQWADSDTIVYNSQEELGYYETSIKDQKDDSIVVEDEKHEPPVRLFKIGVKSKRTTRLTNNLDRIQVFALSPQGHFAFTTQDRSLRFLYDNKIKPSNGIWDLETGKYRQILNETKFNIIQARWAYDGKGFYFANSTTTDPQYVIAGIIEIYYYNLATDRAEKVDLGWERGVTEGPEEIGCFTVIDDGVIALLANGVKRKLARYTRNGNSWKREIITGAQAENILAFESSRDGKTVIYDSSSAEQPNQLYFAQIPTTTLTKVTQLSELNPEFIQKQRAHVEIVHWTGALNEEVEGLLYYPHNYQAGKKYPLVVMIHGGPMLADFEEWWETWSSPKNLFCQQGAFVFKPNYHGSAEYGLKWVESIREAHYYDLEVPDIQKGVDYLIGRGLVDPDRLGVMGWSNGAILSIALTVADTRFKAASVVAGDVDQTSDWANSEFGAAFDQFYLGKSPLEDPQLYMQKSPFYRLAKVRTPTLIFFGTEDRSVSPEQGWMHYRGLQQLGNTDVRFILFPGEKHGPEKFVHQHRKVQEELNWFHKYLFNVNNSVNEALKPDSPLATVLKLQTAQREDRLYGFKVKGRLIPETVRVGDLEIGRFEVTSAQYAEFDKNYLVEPGKENYPASGITFAQAQAYCKWLSGITGTTFRLGNETEMTPIYESAAEQENTLDYWAGYAVNPEDAQALQEIIQTLGKQTSLLKEVGSFLGNEEAIFDLGGNVAEWAMGNNGQAVVLGGCVFLPKDPKARTNQPGSAYIGFRVVKK